MKQRLASIEEQQKKIIEQKNLKNEIKLIMTNLEKFAIGINSNLENLDLSWHTKRDIIRTLIKRIEINQEDVNIVFKINELPQNKGGGGDQNSWQHCCESN